MNGMYAVPVVVSVVNNAAAFVALVAAPLSDPTNVVAVIAPFAKFAEKLALDRCA